MLKRVACSVAVIGSSIVGLIVFLFVNFSIISSLFWLVPSGNIQSRLTVKNTGFLASAKILSPLGRLMGIFLEPGGAGRCDLVHLLHVFGSSEHPSDLYGILCRVIS